MKLISDIATRLRRARRIKAYRLVRSALEAMPDADLIDMGLKRYQLGPVARRKALG